jgi:23S rRNA (guanosine2251-2'-O)-methyltransferase
MKSETKQQQYFLYGINPISEALKSNYSFHKIYVLKGTSNPRVEKIIEIAKAKKIQFYFEDNDFFNKNGQEFLHQGVIAQLKAGSRQIESLTDFLNNLDAAKSTILVLDQITDQHNVGAIARSAVFFKADLIILEDHNSAPINEVVHKISSGASLLMPFCFVEKLSVAIETLKSNSYQIVATDLSEESKDITGFTFNEKSALIIGAEGNGIRPHLLRMADEKIKISGSFDSLNVSNANAVFLYEISRQRMA